jgi:Cys-rich repeat protein
VLRRLPRTVFSHLALLVAAASCALNEPPLVSLNPSEPDAGPTRPPVRPPVIRVDAGTAGDAATEPTVPDEVLPTGCESGTTRPCGPSTQSGVCMLGSRVCVEGVWGDCIGAVMPGERVCGDSADNDCDGQPDDSPDATCECVPGASEPCDTHPGLDGVGACKAGARTCGAAADGKTSSWGACTGSLGPAASDSCFIKGDDANCDGTPNGGCTCVEGEVTTCGPTREVGLCKFGTSSCVNSQYTACAGAVLPKDRSCASALDNDCDGRPDNTIDTACTCAVGTTEPCGGDEELDGVGICRVGTRTCVAGSTGATSAFGACVGAVSATTRRCNSIDDNDCNGQPDNTIDATCACVIGALVECDTHPGLDTIGRCRAGTQSCVAGVDNGSSAYTPCAGSVGPLAADSCTVPGDDSNCDGEPNGGCACVAGEGNEPCASATASRCSATGTCVACAANADCSHLAGLGVCSAGVCVQCLTDLQCGAGAVCNLTTHACEAVTPLPI